MLRFLIDFVCLFESRGEALVLFLSWSIVWIKSTVYLDQFIKLVVVNIRIWSAFITFLVENLRHCILDVVERYHALRAYYALFLLSILITTRVQSLLRMIVGFYQWVVPFDILFFFNFSIVNHINIFTNFIILRVNFLSLKIIRSHSSFLNL